jgi:hypothetical protein
VVSKRSDVAGTRVAPHPTSPEGTAVNRTRVLIAGLGRSGTTWSAGALSLAEGAFLVNEPDQPRREAFAFRAVRPMRSGFFPALEQGDDAPDYERLWAGVFVPKAPRAARVDRFRRRLADGSFAGAGRPDIDRAFGAKGRRRMSPRLRMARALALPPRVMPLVRVPVVKSVNAAFALEWIHEKWNPSILVVVRNPLNVLASRLELKGNPLLDPTPGIRAQFERIFDRELPEKGESRTRSVAWKVGLVTSVLQAKAAANPDWRLVTHEWMCEEPAARFREVCGWLGLAWSEDIDRFLEEHNKPGRGYGVSRIASEQRHRWRTRLTDEDVVDARSVLGSFPIDWAEFGGEPW